MGVIAHGRQTMLDAGWLKRQWAAYDARGKTGRRPAPDLRASSCSGPPSTANYRSRSADSADEIRTRTRLSPRS